MKKFESTFTLFLTLSLMFLALSCTVQFKVRAAEQVFFEDDFESYSVGTFPSAAGWELLFNGAGYQYQVIVDHLSVSPTKSLQLLSGWDWAAHAQIPINSDIDIIGFEAYVMVDENNGVHESSGRIGFSKRDAPNIVNYYAYVSFLDDGEIYVPPGPPGTYLQDYETETWYKVKLIFNRENNSFSVWINDVLRIENHSDPTDNPYDYDFFALSSSMDRGGGRSKIYFDDVKVFSVFEADPKLELEPTSGIAATTLVGSGFAPNSEISVTWNGTTVHTVPNPLVTDGYGKFTAIISALNQTVSGLYDVRAIDELGYEATATFEVVSAFPTSTLEDNSTINFDVDPMLELEPASVITWSSLLVMAPASFAVAVIYTRSIHNPKQERRTQ